MFILTNIYFRPYEFLCSSLSFFENTGSNLCSRSAISVWIKKYQCRPYLPKTTYGPKFVDVHMFSEKLKDVTEKTNIRQFGGLPVNNVRGLSNSSGVERDDDNVRGSMRGI
jgi:hypothetical protein